MHIKHIYDIKMYKSIQFQLCVVYNIRWTELANRIIEINVVQISLFEQINVARRDKLYGELNFFLQRYEYKMYSWCNQLKRYK